MVLAKLISNPRILAVNIIARMFMAGPEYRKAMAGPKPVPRLCILENSRRVAQLQTARMAPDLDVTV